MGSGSGTEAQDGGQTPRTGSPRAAGRTSTNSTTTPRARLRNDFRDPVQVRQLALSDYTKLHARHTDLRDFARDLAKSCSRSARHLPERQPGSPLHALSRRSGTSQWLADWDRARAARQLKPDERGRGRGTQSADARGSGRARAAAQGRSRRVLRACERIHKARSPRQGRAGVRRDHRRGRGSIRRRGPGRGRGSRRGRATGRNQACEAQERPRRG